MEVKRTGYSRSIKASLSYIYYGKYRPSKANLNQPHKNKNGVHRRNEFVAGIGMPGGLSANAFKLNLHYFDYLLNQRPNRRVQATCLVLSFARNDFNFGSESDVLRAIGIGRKFFHKAYCLGNHNHIGIIAAQHDGKSGLPHLHLLVCQLDINTLKSIPSRVNDLIRLRHIGDNVISRYNQHHQHKLLVMPQTRDYGLANRAERTIISRLQPVVNDDSITTRASFVRRCHQYGVQAVFHELGDVRRITKEHVNRYQYQSLLFKLIPPPHHHYMSRYDGWFFPSSKLGHFDRNLRLSCVLDTISKNRIHAKQNRKVSRNASNKSNYANDLIQKGTDNHEYGNKENIKIKRAIERTNATIAQSHLLPTITERAAIVIDKEAKKAVQTGVREFEKFCIRAFEKTERSIQRKITRVKKAIIDESRALKLELLNRRRKPYKAPNSEASNVHERPVHESEKSLSSTHEFSNSIVNPLNNKHTDKRFNNDNYEHDYNPSPPNEPSI